MSDENDETDILNQYGLAGWELISVIKEPQGVVFYFKRVIE